MSARAPGFHKGWLITRNGEPKLYWVQVIILTIATVGLLTAALTIQPSR